MTLWDRILRRRERMMDVLDQDIRDYIEQEKRDNIERGMPPEEARYAALRKFGNVTRIKEETREVWSFAWLEQLWQDIRYGLRMLWKNPGFTAVVVLTLALGIGANTVAFSAYKAFFDSALDARDPGRMVNLAMILQSGATDPYFSYPDYEAYRDRLHSFSGLIAESESKLLALSDAGGSVNPRDSADESLAGRLGLLPFSASKKEFVTTMIVSKNYFSVLAVPPLRGRTFGEVRDLAVSPTVHISENYWQQRFAGDPALLGKTLRLNGVAFALVGITPRDFAGTGLEVPDFWLPLSLQPLLQVDGRSLRDRENPCCLLPARLAPGITIKQGQAEMTLLAGQLRTLHDPHSDWGKPATALLWPGSPFPFPVMRDGRLKYAILLIMVAVGMVLIIACTNVASLQLARAASRHNELCMRLSLGAGRLRLIRQLLTESALLGLLSGVLALLSSWTLMKVLAAVAAQALPAEYGTLIFHVDPDLGIFAYVFAISIGAGILFGLAPALESSRSALSSALKARAGTSPVRSRRLRNVFIAAQVGVASVLLIAGSMLIRSSIHMLKVNTGCDIEHVVYLDLQYPDDSKYTAGRKGALIRELGTRLAALPGVASITHADPPVGGYRRAAVSLNGEIPLAQNRRAALYFSYVQASYFQTLGIPLLSGRNFQSSAGQSEPCVILTESAAQQLWPGKNPIGRSLRLADDQLFHSRSGVLPDGPAYQVIGVARDTRGATLDGSDDPMVYVPMPEDRLQDHSILIRTESDPKCHVGLNS
jgi:predicted permease